MGEDSPLNVDSIHFTSIPEYSEELIDHSIEEKVKKMQDAIETGRLVRDRIRIPMKYPLKRVRLVDSDEGVLQGYKLLEKYIKEELNCLEMEVDKQQDDYVLYSCKPDNKVIGGALKKDFNKNMKKALDKLTNEQLK